MMWLSWFRSASGSREGLFSRQCFSCLGVLPILPSTKCSWGWILCRSLPAPLGTVSAVDVQPHLLILGWR